MAKTSLLGLFTVFLSLCAPAGAAASQTYTVTVFPFRGAHDYLTEQSRIVTDLVTAGLSADPGISLVERRRLDDALAELRLSLTGIVDVSDAVKAGSMVGAQIIVMGRLTTIDRELALFARVIGVETSRVEALMVTGDDDRPLSLLAGELAGKIAGRIARQGPALIGGSAAKTPSSAGLTDRLAGQKLPSVALAIEETFGGKGRAHSTAEAEVLWVLIGAGFEIFDERPGEADVLITGEGLGEFSARTGELVSSTVELKIKAVDSKNRKVLAAAARQHTAVDLSAELAASRAFREAAAAVAADLLADIVEKWNE